MGADKQKTWRDRAKRGWDAAGNRLCEPGLFDTPPVFEGRTFVTALRQGSSARVGDLLLLQELEGKHVVTFGPATVGDCKSLPAEILQSLVSSPEPVCVEVVNINPLSNTLEVAAK
jgi:hypothetical protein